MIGQSKIKNNDGYTEGQRAIGKSAGWLKEQRLVEGIVRRAVVSEGNCNGSRDFQDFVFFDRAITFIAPAARANFSRELRHDLKSLLEVLVGRVTAVFAEVVGAFLIESGCSVEEEAKSAHFWWGEKKGRKICYFDDCFSIMNFLMANSEYVLLTRLFRVKNPHGSLTSGQLRAEPHTGTGTSLVEARSTVGDREV